MKRYILKEAFYGLDKMFSLDEFELSDMTGHIEREKQRLLRAVYYEVGKAIVDDFIEEVTILNRKRLRLRITVSSTELLDDEVNTGMHDSATQLS